MYRNVKCKLPLLFFAQRKKKKGWHFVEVLEGSLIFVRPFLCVRQPIFLKALNL